MTKNDRAIIDLIWEFANSEEFEIKGDLKPADPKVPETKDKQITLMKFFGFKRNNVSRWVQDEEEGICDENKIRLEQLSNFRNYVQSAKFKESSTKKDLLAKFASHLLLKQVEIVTGESVEYHQEAVKQLRAVTKATLSMCQSESVFISITSLENLQDIISTLLNRQSDTKTINLSLNRELLLDAINIIESYAYSDGGNFSDKLTVKLFVPTYTVFANIMSGMSEGEFLGLIQDEDSVFVELSDIGTSLVSCEIEAQLHQKTAWNGLPKSPELRLLTKMQRDGVYVSGSVIEIVTARYERTTPYIKGNVFERLSEIDADLPTDFVKFANDNALASQL